MWGENNNYKPKGDGMKDLYRDFDKAISRLKVDADKIKNLLAEASVYDVDIADEISDIRSEAYDLVDACDASEGLDDYIEINPYLHSVD